MRIKTLFCALTSLAMAMLLSACEQKTELQQVAFEGKTMGTTYHVKYIDEGNQPNLPKPEQIKQQLDQLLVEVNREMSTYQPDSEISQFNQLRQTNQGFAISDDFALVVQEAIRLNQVTQGALDVTVGPLVNLWGFGPDKRLNKEPSPAQIAERSGWVGIDKLSLELAQGEQKAQLRKAVPELYVDLSSIAKGFGVDKLAMHLESLGIQNYLVEIGGELRGKGNNLAGEPWRIAIEKPEFKQGTAIELTVPLQNQGMATSGSYRNYFEDEQGNRLSHIIEPHNLRPISHNLVSITVFADTTMTADGLSTGLFVLGPDKAMEIAEQQKLAIFMIIKNGNQYEDRMSTAFKALLNQQ